jgi:hypothetical protein
MKTYDSFRRKVLKNIVIEFGMKINYEKIKMFSNESYRSPGRQKFSDTFTVSNVSQKGDPTPPRFVHCAVEYVIRSVQADYEWLK